MKTNVSPSVICAVLVAMATASLFSMLSLNQINYIVHGDLYNFGLQFSYRWAMPYWIFSGIVFGLSWANIATSMIVTVYILRKKQKQTGDSEANPQHEKIAAAQVSGEGKEQRKLSDFSAPQGEEVEEPKEKPTEVAREEFVEETVESIKETEEASIPPNEERQSVL